MTHRAKLKMAVRLFRSEFAPRSVRRHNARQWLRSVEALGSKWRGIPSRRAA